MASSSSNASQAPMREVGQKLVILKILCRTDISRRLVLPKNEAEANMPSLAANEARPVQFYDYLTASFWEFLYRCWENPNGKVRSYYIEQAGAYFKRHGLRPKDKILIYQEQTGSLIIGFERVHALHFTTPGHRFREPLHSLIEDVSWVKRPRYSEMFPTWLDETSSSSELNPSFQQAMEPIPSRDEPTSPSS